MSTASKALLVCSVSLFVAVVIQGCASSRSNADREAECAKRGVLPKTTEMSLCVTALVDQDYQRDTLMLKLMNSQPSPAAPSIYSGQPVYGASECIGPVINGVCNGSIMPNAGYHPTCYGTMLNGQCTGPMF